MRRVALILIACTLAMPVWAAAGANPHPAAQTDDDGWSWVDVFGSGCIALAFAAGVTLSILEKRPLTWYDPDELAPPQRNRRRLKRRHTSRVEGRVPSRALRNTHHGV